MIDSGKIHGAIEIHNLSKSYGTKQVLDDISFQVNKGEVMGFLGPNGAGKSTVMNIITGYLVANSGKVYVDGIDISENPLEVKKKIGYLPEIPPLYTDMTVLEYLEFVYKLKGVKESREKHLRDIMNKVHIYDVRRRIIQNLSKGYKQRVGLAQALIGNPQVLILDEPTVGLDPKQIIELREVISGLAKERTVILSTHIMQEVLAVCDSYIIINKGKVAAHGKLDEISGAACRAWQLRIKRIYSEIEPVLAQIDGLEKIVNMGSFERGTNDVTVMAKDGCDIRESIFKACSTAGFSILSFSAVAQSLEELFLQVIRDESVEKNMVSQESKRQGVGV